MALYELHRYLLMTLDPVHIGTGGYRLGRVDNSIAREAGTKLPKIPGTSLHGAIRSYAARIYETPEAAGLNHEKVKSPETNPVYYTFGYIQKSQNNNDDKSAKGLSGVVNISDAHILFFPIYSMNGTVWVTTQEKLEEAGFFQISQNTQQQKEVLYSGEKTENINLGWLMLKISEKIAITPCSKLNLGEVNRWEAIKDRIVIVHSSLFSQVVNSNLEVRTSVAIDPKRGAADDGALFTYEALPRATFLTMDVVIDDYRNKFPSLEKLSEWEKLPEEELKKLHLTSKEVEEAIKKKELLEKLGSTPRCVVNAGLNLVEYLGVGGMGTRGFGRIAKVSSWEVANG